MSDAPSGIYDALFGTRDGAKFGRIDPADHADQPVIHFDALTPTDDTALEVTKPDDRYELRFVKSGKIICFLGTPDQAIGDALPRCFETRNVRGASESPLCVTYDNGMHAANVEYIDTRGNHCFSCTLTLVARA